MVAQDILLSTTPFLVVELLTRHPLERAEPVPLDRPRGGRRVAGCQRLDDLVVVGERPRRDVGSHDLRPQQSNTGARVAERALE